MSLATVGPAAAPAPPPEDTALPVGVGAPSREGAQQMQRERILQAMLEIAAERHYQGSTITDVVAHAGVSRVTFYRLFGDLPTCFLETLATALARTVAVISKAYERESSWPDAVLAGLAALLTLFDSEPQLARVCLLEAPAAGAPALQRHTRELAALQPLLEAGSAHAPVDRQPSPLTAEATIGSIAWLLQTRLATGDAPPFTGLLQPLARIALTPYLDTPTLTRALHRVEPIGLQAAQRRLAEPTPSRTADLPKALRNPTAHRARAVVRYLASHPGASNQQIAAATAIPHIGQTSELLTRLERLGLLHKRAGRAGHPNAWTLSASGELAAHALADGW
jgi:AcrR family transcriptional regulator